MALEYWTPVLGIILAVAGIMALFTKSIKGKIDEYKETHKPVHDAIDKDMGELRHNLKNERQRIDSLERARVDDVARIVQLETNLRNIEKGQERIEAALERQAHDAEVGRAEIVATIREMSKRDIK